MTYAAKRWNRMVKWCEENPAKLYADYREELPADMVKMILRGKFDSFWEAAWLYEFQISEYPEFWDYWESEFATAFGYKSFDDMPERIQDIARENQHIDSKDYWKTVCRNTRPHVNAVLEKRNGELIYAPGHRSEYEFARYIKRAFGFDGSPWQIVQKLECLYGGYDMESAVIIGTVDLWQILESETVPTHIEVGPRDSDNLLWYEFYNGAGNLGRRSLKIGKTRKFKATFHVDGTRGYGIDSCYGFCGYVWGHELSVTGVKA